MDEELLIRPARPDDRPAMEHICAHTWENGDYIPQVWDEWLADERGALMVGEWGGAGGPVVALSKITAQPGGQIWLEGMRVDPDYRGRGIGRRFLEFNLEYGRSHGARAVRLATSNRNTAVHHMAGQQGMKHVGTYAPWLAEPLPGGPQLAFLTLQDGPEVRAFLENSPVLAHTRGLYTQDWAAQELSAERATQLLDEGQIAAEHTPEGQISALIVVSLAPGDDEMWLGFADGEPRALGRLAAAARGHAAQAAGDSHAVQAASDSHAAQAAGDSSAAQAVVDRVRIMLPDLDWLRGVFRAAGYGWGDWDGELWIFESRRIEAPTAKPSADRARR